MFRWSLKSLLAEPLRLIAGSLGVASAFILVIFFQAVFEGESRQIVAYIENTDADVWVMQDGVSNMHMASSMLWDWKEDRIAAMPGVSDVTSILYMNTVMSAGGKQWFSYIVGLAPDASRGGSWAMESGKPLPDSGEAVIPDVIARLTDIGLGDNISILDGSFRIAGLSRGSFSMANSVTFVTKSDLSKLMDAGGSVSYIMVKAAPGVSPQALAARIEENVDKVNALPRDEFIRRDREMAMQMGTEIIQIMTIIGTLLAVLIVAFTAYYHVVHKQQELAIVKALGFRNRHIYTSAFMQTAAIALCGYLIALVVAYTLLPLLPAAAPQISIAVSGTSLVRIGIIALLVTGLASLLPARRVAVVDPMNVFQS